MHGRHRSPANGYRVGPRGSGRRHGLHGSGNLSKRDFGRGRGQFRPFRSKSRPSPRKGGDIFLEAGRLATEYLVSKGLLSPDVLSGGRWFNGSSKKQEQDFLEFKGDARMSAHSQLGNKRLDSGSGRRRYNEDSSPRGTRNHVKGSRRGGTFWGYCSGWGMEYARNSMSSERVKGSPDREGINGVVSGHDKELQVEKNHDNVTGKSRENELVVKAHGLEYEVENQDVADEMALKESSSRAEKDILSETDGELGRKCEDSTNLNESIQDVSDASAIEEIKKEQAEDDFSLEYSVAEGSHPGNSCPNLLAFCNSLKVPTRIRSSLASSIAKVVSVPSSGDEHKSTVGPQLDGSARGSWGDSPSHASHNPRGIESDVNEAISIDSAENEQELGVAYGVDQNHCMDQPVPDTKTFSVHSAANAKNTGIECGLEQGKCTRSKSFPLGTTSHGQPAECVEESSSAIVAEQSKCIRSDSFTGNDSFYQLNEESSHDSHSYVAVQEIDEIRPLEVSDMNGGTKKVKEWLPTVTTTDEYLHFSNLIKKIENSKEEGNAAQNELPVDVTQEGLVHISQFQKHGGESRVEYAQEKEFFPDSFNLEANIMETSDRSGSHHNEPSQLYPSISGPKKTMRIDVDLSMSSNLSGHARNLTDIKEIEVIDLEDDSAQEEKAGDNAERMREAVFTGLGECSSQATSSGIITDVDDNYDGLMISDYFKTSQNCAPAPAEIINPLQNEMGMANREGNLGDDDSIYMSLDEIPLGYLRAWEQPPSLEYDKHF